MTEIEIDESLSSVVTRRENGIDDCLVVANDENGTLYLNTVVLGQEITIRYKWEDKDDVWYTVFTGKVVELNPNLNMGGETCSIRAVGKAIAFKEMRVATEYGIQANYTVYDNEMPYVDEWTNETSEWNKTGSSPYLQIGESDYISLPIIDDNLGASDYAFKFADIEVRDHMVLDYFTLCLRCVRVAPTSATKVWLTVDVWDGTAWVYLPPKLVPYGLSVYSADWIEWNVLIALDPTKFNDYKIRVNLWGITGPREGTVYVTAGCCVLHGWGYSGTEPYLRDIITNSEHGIIPIYVETIFGGESSGYSFNTDYVWDMEDTFKYFYFPYESAFDCLKDIINVACAMRYPESGLHWIVLPDGKLCIAPVGNHQVYGAPGKSVESVWPTYARVTPIEVSKHMILEDFTHEEPEANYVIVAGNFVIPINESATEGDLSVWEKIDEDDKVELSEESIIYGSEYSTKLSQVDSIGNRISQFRINLGNPIEFSKIATAKNIPTINFYYMTGDLGITGIPNDNQRRLRAYKDWNNYFEYNLDTEVTETNKWYEFSIRIDDQLWTEVGSLEWDDVQYVGFSFQRGGMIGDANIWIDGFEIIGAVIRVAYHSDSINEWGCKMKPPIKDNLATTDSLNADDDTNVLARVAKAELIRSMHALFSGKIIIPLDPNILAGQFIRIKNPRNINFPHDSPEFNGMPVEDYLTMRIVEVQHSFSIVGATTILTLVDDLYNSISIGPVDAYSTIIRAVSPDAQDKTLASLKGTREFDPELTRLEKDYA